MGTANASNRKQPGEVHFLTKSTRQQARKTLHKLRTMIMLCSRAKCYITLQSRAEARLVDTPY